MHMPAILLVLGISLPQPNAQRYGCREENIKVMEDFDDRRFTGIWFEFAWKVPDFIPLDTNFLDFVMLLTPISNGLDRRQLGRFPLDSPNCTELNTSLEKTGTRGKYLVTGSSGHTFWILDTDYDNYALTYQCRAVDNAGFCTQNIIWMWTRAPFPDPKFILIMDRQLAMFCFTRDQLTFTDHNTECLPGCWGPNPAPVSVIPDDVDIEDEGDKSKDDNVSNRTLAIIIVSVIISTAFICVLVILLLCCCGFRVGNPHSKPQLSKPSLFTFGQSFGTTSNYGQPQYI